jgi:hypothetical protein
MVNGIKAFFPFILFIFFFLILILILILFGVPILTYYYFCTGQQHVTIEVCTCTDFITILLHNKLWPATPVSPGTKHRAF